MVKMIHAQFGTTLWVADDRVEEYKAAGHKLAAAPAPKEPAKEDPKPRKVKK